MLELILKVSTARCRMMGGQVSIIIQVDDVSGDQKTAENLVQHLERGITELKTNWDIVHIAIVTDALGECLKAKKILQLKYLSLIILDC